MAIQLRSLLLSPSLGVVWGLEMSDGSPITASNVREYVQLRTEERLLGARSSVYAAVRRGLFAYAPLREHLQALPVVALRELLAGREYFAADDVVALIDASRVAEHLRDALKRFLLSDATNTCARRFLQFVTGYAALPLPGGRLIRVVEAGYLAVDALPVAHTCSFSLDLPLYLSGEVLEEKMAFALANFVDQLDIQ